MPTIAEAVAAYDRGLASDGSDWEVHAARADALAYQAEYRLKRGLAADESLASGWQAAERGRPTGDRAFPLLVQQHLALVEAERALLQGRDAREWLERVRTLGRRVVTDDEAFGHLRTARAELLWAAQGGASAFAALQRAQRESEQAATIYSHDVECLTGAAQARRRLAEWEVDHHRSPASDLAAAHAYLDRALHDTKDYAPARLERAALLRIAARHDSTLEAQAQAELAAARAIDPRVDYLELRLASKER
jgi:hypothetical protein